MENKIIIKAENGIHARPAGNIVKLASGFKCDITINGINAKSIMGLMSSGISKGDEVIIKTSGVDEEEAMKALLELLNNLD